MLKSYIDYVLKYQHLVQPPLQTHIKSHVSYVFIFVNL